MKEELLAIENGVLAHNGHSVFDGLHLHIYKDEIRGLIFDDILIKRFLLDILKGNMVLESGRLRYDEKAVSAAIAAKTLRKAVTVIEKKSKLIESISLEENIFLFSDSMWVIDNKRYANQFKNLEDQLGIQVDAAKGVESLSAKDRVLVELMKACVERKKLVILDDITIFLKEAEAEEIYHLLSKLCKQGMSFILTIGFEETGTHFMDQISVIQNRNVIASIDSKEADIYRVFMSLIADNRVKDAEKKRIPVTLKPNDNEVIFSFQDVCARNIQNLNFDLEAGDILKLYYMEDSSCEQIIKLLKGEETPESGKIILNGALYRAKSVFGAVKEGVCFIEELPYWNMLFGNMSVLENLAIPLHEKIPSFWIARKYTRSVKIFAEQIFGEDVLGKRISNLPLITAQQIAYSKWQLYLPHVVVCVNPFLDLDIRLRETTIDLLNAYKELGIAIIVLTSNLYTARKIEGEIIYIHNGHVIDENQMYHALYGRE